MHSRASRDLFWFLLLVGLESGVTFSNQSQQSEANIEQMRIIVDSQLITALQNTQKRPLYLSDFTRVNYFLVSNVTGWRILEKRTFFWPSAPVEQIPGIKEALSVRLLFLSLKQVWSSFQISQLGEKSLRPL